MFGCLEFKVRSSEFGVPPSGGLARRSKFGIPPSDGLARRSKDRLKAELQTLNSERYSAGGRSGSGATGNIFVHSRREELFPRGGENAAHSAGIEHRDQEIGGGTG